MDFMSEITPKEKKISNRNAIAEHNASTCYFRNCQEKFYTVNM